ncbi:hypothetical protein BDR26DRAFT_855507 [Obelidium mucronatum]|nr:hypothetical protein BDR26DRAFT_855507 [Obelidium mucronatum]
MRKLPLRQCRITLQLLSIIIIATIALRINDANDAGNLLKRHSNIRHTLFDGKSGTHDDVEETPVHLNSKITSTTARPQTTKQRQPLLQVLPPPPTSPLFLSTDPLHTVSRITMYDNTIPNTINPYKVCNMEKVCQRDGETVFYTRSREFTMRLQELYVNCCVNKTANCRSLSSSSSSSALSHHDTLFCGCFSPESRLVFETISADDNKIVFENEGAAWMISQWLQTKRHHIAHFSYSVIQFYNIQLHARELGLPSHYKTIVFQDGSEEFNAFERDLGCFHHPLALPTAQVSAAAAVPSLLEDFRFLRKNRKDADYGTVNMSVPKQCCFEKLHGTIRGDIYATHVEDMDAFKKAANRVLQIDTGTPTSCPPRRIAILTRKSGMGLRRIMNLPKVMKLIQKLINNTKSKFPSTAAETNRIEIDIISPSEKDSLLDTSANLTNLVFAHANSVVIEVSPIYKRAFRHLGEVSRVTYINSVRHRPVNVPFSLSKRFEELLPMRKKGVVKDGEGCDFERMLTDLEYRCGLTQEEHILLSRADFVVHLKKFREALEEGLRHLNRVCEHDQGRGWLK